MNKILKRKLPTSIRKRRKGDIEKIVANTNKLRKFFSWQSRYDSLSTIISTALKWEKKLLKN